MDYYSKVKRSNSYHRAAAKRAKAKGNTNLSGYHTTVAKTQLRLNTIMPKDMKKNVFEQWHQ